MSNETFEELCDGLIRDWKGYKKEAVKTGNFGPYREVLGIIQGEFSKLYTKVTKPRLVALVEQILRIASCEIKGIMIKYNKEKKELPF